MRWITWHRVVYAGPRAPTRGDPGGGPCRRLARGLSGPPSRAPRRGARVRGHALRRRNETADRRRRVARARGGAVPPAARDRGGGRVLLDVEAGRDLPLRARRRAHVPV